MQDILLPLLVLNLLVTFWLLRQHILRQGRRHRRRNRIDRWLNDLQLEIRGHDQALINHGEIFLEHRSAMAEINKDHYALNERLDGISVYDIKAILAGQERMQMLESDIEAIRETLEHHTAKITEFMSFKYVNDGWAASIDREIKGAKEVRAVNSDRVSKLEHEVSTLKEAIETVIDNYGARLTGHTERLMVLESARISDDNWEEVNKELALIKRVMAGNEETNSFVHSEIISDVRRLRNSHEMISATVETLRMQYCGLSEDFSQTKLKLGNRLIDLENRARPFNPDTLIDSLKTDFDGNHINRFPAETYSPLMEHAIIEEGDEVFNLMNGWMPANNLHVGFPVGPRQARRKITTHEG